MLIVDGHCDTLSRIAESGGSIRKNKYHSDIERMLNFDGFVQFFACFVPPEIGPSSYDYTLKLISLFNKQVNLHNDVISLCCNYDDAIMSIANKKVAAMLSIENGAALCGQIKNLNMFYSLGVRSICLSWNNGNDITGGIEQTSAKRGLTRFGEKVVRAMNDLGMIIDVSHMSEAGFWDVAALSRSPVIASHSNSKKVCNHPRNLSDEQILAIGNAGGIIGINLYPEFLGGQNPGSEQAVKHIEHIISITGTDSFIGLGCDFDGITETPFEIRGLQDIGRIAETLLEKNYPETTVRKIFGLNFLRVIKSVINKSP